MRLNSQALARDESGESLLSDYSLEITTKDLGGLKLAADRLMPGTTVAIAFLPGEELESRIDAARLVRDLGFEPKVHLPARRIHSEVRLGRLLERLAVEVRLRQVLVIAGDAEIPVGPFPHALSVIESGLLEANGIEQVSLGGHPEHHPAMDRQACTDWLVRKVAAICERGMSADIVTQFGFDADIKLTWLSDLRTVGINVPVALGIPGPTSARRLLAFAARCGVGASTSVLRKYGLSLTALMSTAGPDRMVNTLEEGFDPRRHGQVSLHFYPFGGLDKTVDWIAAREG